MKKVLLIALALMLAFSFTACGGGGGGGGGGGDSEAPIVIQFAHVEPEDRSVHQGAVMFKEYVEKESEGRIQVNILANGIFGGDREACEGVALGAIQMCQPVTSALTSYNDDFMILDLPFMFNSREASYIALDGELGEALNSLLPQYDIIGLGYNDNGLRQMTNNIRPINTPEDLAGVKMRVMESNVFITMFNLLGANPVPMSFTEVYTALQQGTVDGQENGAALVLASKFQEVQKYISLTGHVYSVNATLINKAFYEDLSDEYKAIINYASKEFLTKKQRELEGNGDADAIRALEAAGMEVNEVSPANMEKFREKVFPMYDEYKGSVIRAELFDMVDRANAAAE